MNVEVTADREQMTDEEKELFLCDLKVVCAEYFEADGKYSMDVTRTEKGFSVCIIFDAVRIKKFKKPR
ncbi:MAG: hypothetical protein K2I17_04340 [Clostridia bacterium]|nr:hypothetical protein [Clostridia bacterium]MDE6790991.1 hypothetical protein [Clostridia bacterium]MDE7400609.1 hypothetical protein [Clostridia bacterium]